ncbi:MAG: hypothetical protein Q4A78_13250 [Peptostreptococcaceae bacterium]|nr:hypothetical protein [Peptostreptococcaceae bacterium]
MNGEKTLIDFGEVNIKRLIVTNDKEYFEKRKSESNVEALLTPQVLSGELYLIGFRSE